MRQKNSRTKQILLTIIILAIVVLVPPMLYFFGFGTSMAMGTCVACTFIILISQFNVFKFQINNKEFKQGLVFFVVLLLILISHLLVVQLFLNIDIQRALLSFIPLGMILIGGLILCNCLTKIDPKIIEYSIFFMFWTLATFGIIAALKVNSLGAEIYSKPVFPFTEPSFYSISFLPFLMYCNIASEGFKKLIYLGIGFILAILLQNLTFMLGVLLIFMLVNKVKWIIITLPWVFLLFYNLDIDYYLERMQLFSPYETFNLSSLTYIQGWELLEESIKSMWGLGIGFQQLGVNGTSVDASYYIYKLIGSYSNILDGGFTFSKIISELGLIGFILIYYYIKYVIKCLLLLYYNRIKKLAISPIILFSSCIIICYSIELFVRGQGYFTGSSILFIMAIFTIKRLKNIYYYFL